MRRAIGTTFAALAAALILAGSVPARADFSMSKGRTVAIRQQLAKRINKDNLMHVGQVRPQDLRIRTRSVQPTYRNMCGMMIIGADNRNVSWRHKTGILRGQAKAHTPVLGNGGRLTTISNFKYTLMPRSLPRAR
jgi:hypothetical protein